MIALFDNSGEARKRHAQRNHEKHRAAIIRQGQRQLLAAIIAKGEGTADDARRGLEIPPHINPKCLGAVPGGLVRAGIIRRKAYRNSVRGAAHARPLSVWEMANPTKAMTWRESHPELTPPPNVQGELPLENEKSEGVDNE